MLNLSATDRAPRQTAAAIRILSVDDHPLFREGLGTVIAHQSDMCLAATARTGEEAVRLFASVRPDVTLMDLRLPDMSGIETSRRILQEFAHARILVLSTYGADAEIQQALAAGACGYILKSSDHHELTSAIRAVHAGRKYVRGEVALTLAQHLVGQYLTDREVQVLGEVARGTRNKLIGKRLSISEDTVKAHL